ncbi:hypothetical protein L3X38_040057 [Prunus dulcis]|uniref:Uncharacterized protein n=1 Tax=Prunus dulcis TaxID=3755 RepID=A0AAD4YT53_PRUDU|nr:hypothetical protein L3X38_040057 [Prunus dulcis]
MLLKSLGDQPNPTTSLELQQLMRVMETMAQTMATQNAQINERFDRWLGQKNGQNGNQGALNGVPAAGPQVEAQPNVFGVNLPQPNPLAGGNPAPVVNVPPKGNNPYAAVNQFQVFPPYNQFCPRAHQGAEANFARPHINQFVGVSGSNNSGENANNPLLGNQAIDRGAVEQMIQDMLPHARMIGRPVYHRPYIKRNFRGVSRFWILHYFR